MKVKDLYKIFLSCFALNCLKSIFCSDAHHIVSERGWEILAKNKFYCKNDN